MRDSEELSGQFWYSIPLWFLGLLPNMLRSHSNRCLNHLNWHLWMRRNSIIPFLRQSLGSAPLLTQVSKTCVYRSDDITPISIMQQIHLLTTLCLNMFIMDNQWKHRNPFSRHHLDLDQAGSSDPLHPIVSPSLPTWAFSPRKTKKCPARTSYRTHSRDSKIPFPKTILTLDKRHSRICLCGWQ